MEKTYLAPSTRPTCRPSPAPLQRAACRPGRQAGARRRPQRAPRTCSPPRRSTRPANAVDRSLSLPRTPPDTSSPLQLLSLALPRHGRRHRRHPLAVATPSVNPTPCRRVQELRRRPLHRASRAPCARAARDHRTDLARARRRRRSPSTPSPPQLVPDPAGGLYGSAVSLATPPTLPLSFPSRVATARRSPARTAADLVADVLPAILRPPLGVHRTHHVA